MVKFKEPGFFTSASRFSRYEARVLPVGEDVEVATVIVASLQSISVYGSFIWFLGCSWISLRMEDPHTQNTFICCPFCLSTAEKI